MCTQMLDAKYETQELINKDIFACFDEVYAQIDEMKEVRERDVLY